MDQKQKMKLPAGVKKHIRIEKARIRHDFLSREDVREQIEKLYNKFEYFILKPKQEIKKIIKQADKKILSKTRVPLLGPSSKKKTSLKLKSTAGAVKKKIADKANAPKPKTKKIAK